MNSSCAYLSPLTRNSAAMTSQAKDAHQKARVGSSTAPTSPPTTANTTVRAIIGYRKRVMKTDRLKPPVSSLLLVLVVVLYPALAN